MCFVVVCLFVCLFGCCFFVFCFWFVCSFVCFFWGVVVVVFFGGVIDRFYSLFARRFISLLAILLAYCTMRVKAKAKTVVCNCPFNRRRGRTRLLFSPVDSEESLSFYTSIPLQV